MQIVAIVVSLLITAVGIVLFVRAVRSMLGVIRIGQPAHRTDNPVGRTMNMVKETLGHTRMLQWRWVGAGHWFIFIGFGLLFFTLLTAFGQLFDAGFTIPLLGTFFLWEWVSELFTALMIVAITALFVYRATRPKDRVRGVRGRLYRSTMWHGYFVEAVIFGVGVCIVFLRGLEYALYAAEGSDHASAFHFPLSFPIGHAFTGFSTATIENLIYLIAMLKIVISFAWMITISLNLTMGVAWHRFTAFFNIWFKRDADGRTALGAMKPLTSGGKVVSLADIEEMDEATLLGVGAVEDFAWKGILDFTTCTECGRCQSQCPAWNTEKPLNPKLLITALREHAYAKAPYLQASSDEERAALLEGSDTLTKEVERPLVGDTGDGWFYMPDDGSAVIDSEALWNCTSCGACVQQCPVDIEHVDHIMDMRRYAVLVESNFPAELNGLFKGLENKGNPWNMSSTARMDWAKGLDFEVKVVGESIESLDEVDWLFWVGCAGAYEDRAKKTTRAVAELLDMAGVSFGVLGNGETCTGDPARRAGNEFVFQGLAQQNAETFKEHKVKKVVSTCAHCFNTLKNEYQEFGVELEVVHHTQLLNRLVREGKLTPVATGEGAHQRSITYHDPCYIGRHNGVYTPPRELLQILPGAQVVEMERNSEKSFCCGAGGARLWMEENTGERINVNRTNEAVGTGADQIAVGCPFCRVMLSDGLTAAQAKGEAREEVEVLDVAQMLLASVKGEVATKMKPGGAPVERSKTSAAKSAATKAEPEAGDVTQTDDTITATEDSGPLAKASGGSSLFDTPAAQEPGDTADKHVSVPEEARAAEPTSKGGSLFDVEAPISEAGTGGSLFDVGGDEPAAAATEPEPAAASEPEPQATKTEPKPSAEPVTTEPAPAAATLSSEIPEGGSLFDISAPEPAPASDQPTVAAESEPEPASEPEPEPEATKTEPKPSAEPVTTEPAPAAASLSSEIPEGGSLFDISAPEPASDPTPAPAQPAAAAEPEPAAASEPEPQATKTEPKPSAEPVTTEPAPAAASLSTEIPEGGSLFDISAPDPAPASDQPTVAAESEPEPASEPEPELEATKTEPKPSAEPVTTEPAPAAASLSSEIPEGGSLFDISAPDPAPASDQPTVAAQSEPEPASEPEPEPVAVTTASAASVEKPKSSRSMFDIAAPAARAAAPPATPASATNELAETPAPVPEPEPELTPAQAVSAAATAAASGASTRTTTADEEASAQESPATTATTEAPEAADAAARAADAEDSTEPAEIEAEHESDVEAPEPAPAAPASSSGPGHTPRTDADISGSSSLFDL